MREHATGTSCVSVPQLKQGTAKRTQFKDMRFRIWVPYHQSSDGGAKNQHHNSNVIHLLLQQMPHRHESNTRAI